ncbi:MAG TPA: hypothetical protein DF294_07470 [Psychrobacter sp.]|nr:hypothetical protein [Psychrobacter sp.]
MRSAKNKTSNNMKVANIHLIETLELPLNDPIWYPTAVKPGQSITIKAMVKYLNIGLTSNRKAVLLIKSYDDVNEEVDVSFENIFKSETFGAHFKYLVPTQGEIEELYTFVVPEGVTTIHFGFNRFLCSENEQVIVSDLTIYPELKVKLSQLQDESIVSEKSISDSEAIKNDNQNINIAQAMMNLGSDESLKSLKDLKVSAIMDEFTYKSYKEECTIDQLSIHSWEKQLNDFKPHLLFVESAWRGFNDEWDRKISNSSPELEGIFSWCHENNVPTMFWNKEDPIHFETFITLAKNFDVVFTTDIDCIERYKLVLKHDNVYWLPFAAQLKTNNPIEKYQREDTFCFAGAYYVKYPDRTKDLNNFVKVFSSFKPVAIYDRNYYKNDENYKFPSQFEFFIKGNLPFDQIDKAYKGYNYTINLNSIKYSQSMFARRVFEVLASNTLLVSNFSRGLRLIFGDLVLCSDSPNQILKELQPLQDSSLANDYFKLLALRKILSEHTYTHRLSHIANKTLNINLTNKEVVLVLSVITNLKDLEKAVKSFNRQKYIHKNLVLLSYDSSIQSCNDYTVLNSKEQVINYISNIEKISFISFFSLKDFYGENYLYDLLLASQFSDNRVIGKSKYFKANEANSIELVKGKAYTLNETLNLRASLVPKTVFSSLIEENSNFESIEIDVNTISTDYFSYCKDYNKFDFKEIPLELSFLKNIDTGLRIEDFNRLENKKAELEDEDNIRFISSQELYDYFPKSENKDFSLDYSNQSISIISNLESNKHTYHYAIAPINISELFIEPGGKQKIYFDIGIGLNLQFVFKYLDYKKNNISHSMIYGMKNTTLDIPSDCHYISIGLRIYGPGKAVINKILLGHKIIDPAFVITNKQYLLVTNHYPSYDDLYKNGFVHSRVRSYKEQGIDVEVFRLRKDEKVSYNEFEGIDVITGSNNALEKIIKNNNFKTIMIHFLDQNIWHTINKFIDTHRVVVWVHGAEIQSWHRRAFNYENESQAQKAKTSYETRAKFWRELIKNIPKNLHFVFVSKYFADEVMSDLDITIPESHYEIIANPIDTEKFSYQKKDVQLRTKILSIRPYASRTYANDLTVKAILELSKEYFFNDLEFRIIGDGVLFEETVEPLRNFNNVILEQRFLNQAEIADIHKEYGIFLCPSRMDTQGVSRDEAMSSGLVPITNNVGAISEFLDGFEELMVPADDYEGIVKLITRLYNEPEIFSLLSENISKSIVSREKYLIINKEINVIKYYEY